MKSSKLTRQKSALIRRKKDLEVWRAVKFNKLKTNPESNTALPDQKIKAIIKEIGDHELNT